MFRLERLTNRPILEPDPSRSWEAAAVFNPAAVTRDGKIVLLYRATDRPFFEADADGSRRETPFVSVIGYAESADGIHFVRRPAPVLVGRGPHEARGCEDPRVTRLDGTYYMVYTAYGGREPGDWRIAVATSRDLVHWTGQRVLLEEPGNKNGALLPARPRGRYFLFHRRHPDIWISESRDLRHWDNHRPLLGPRSGTWDSVRVGIGPPPVLTRNGWLLVYHGVDGSGVYRLGAALLDAEDPGRVLARLDEPILEPELPWERDGLMPRVVFACGLVEMGSELNVYYGAADTRVGVASVRRETVEAAFADLQKRPA
ncbi:MAG: glycosidase [Clostridia bacterium]|nr:glycosidase [Clostridia bacterium]